MQFDIGDQKIDGFAVHCREFSWAFVLLGYLERMGYNRGGVQCSSFDTWEKYEEKTCYLIGCNGYSCSENKSVVVEPLDYVRDVLHLEVTYFLDILKWTEQDLTIARGRIAEGYRFAMRDCDGLLFCRESFGAWDDSCPQDILPQIATGMQVDLREIVERYS